MLCPMEMSLSGVADIVKPKLQCAEQASIGRTPVRRLLFCSLQAGQLASPDVVFWGAGGTGQRYSFQRSVTLPEITLQVWGDAVGYCFKLHYFHGAPF